MTLRFKADGATGKVGIYTYTGSDDPLTSPTTNVGSLKFHSDFKYIGLAGSAPSLSATISVAAGAKPYATTHTIGAHGKSGVPFVFGRIYAQGAWQPFVGAVPVYVATTSGVSGGHSRVITMAISVDATNVYAYEMRSSDSFSFPAVSVPVEVWISTELA